MKVDTTPTLNTHTQNTLFIEGEDLFPCILALVILKKYLVYIAIRVV